MQLIDEIYMKDPCVGSRRLVKLLERDHGETVNLKRVQRLRRKMGIETIWCRPRRTSISDSGHRKYPYLLRDHPLATALRYGHLHFFNIGRIANFASL